MKAQRESLQRVAVGELRDLPSESGESLGDLVGDLVTQASDLLKGEVALLKAELREEVRLYRPRARLVAIGVAFGLLAAMALLTAGVTALSTYTGLVLAGVIFGAVLAAVAALLMSLGLRRLDRHSSN